MKITGCKVNHFTNPIGYKISNPVFSWKVEEAKGKKQTEAKLCVSLKDDMTDCVVDLGFRTDIDCLGFNVKINPVPYTRYFWKRAISLLSHPIVRSVTNAWVGPGMRRCFLGPHALLKIPTRFIRNIFTTC